MSDGGSEQSPHLTGRDPDAAMILTIADGLQSALSERSVASLQTATGVSHHVQLTRRALIEAHAWRICGRNLFSYVAEDDLDDPIAPSLPQA